MTIQRAGKHLCALQPKIHPAIFDGRNSALRDPCKVGKLALTELLEFAHNAYRLTHRDFNSLFCKAKFLHFIASCNHGPRHG